MVSIRLLYESTGCPKKLTIWYAYKFWAMYDFAPYTFYTRERFLQDFAICIWATLHKSLKKNQSIGNFRGNVCFFGPKSCSSLEWCCLRWSNYLRNILKVSIIATSNLSEVWVSLAFCTVPTTSSSRAVQDHVFQSEEGSILDTKRRIFRRHSWSMLSCTSYIKQAPNSILIQFWAVHYRIGEGHSRRKGNSRF